MTKHADLVGQRFGLLVVTRFAETRVHSIRSHKAYWHCRCDCGNKTIVSTDKLRGGHTRSCGCLHQTSSKRGGLLPIVAGQRFGRLVVMKEVDHPYHESRRFKMRCDCGRIQPAVRLHDLRSGATQSCGCLLLETLTGSTNPNFKHGYKVGRQEPPEYTSWRGMIDRCENPNHSGFKDYGGRGIKICKRWRNSFAAFLADMGPRPSGKSIDRKENDGNYTKSNCKWSTQKEQRNNQRERTYKRKVKP